MDDWVILAPTRWKLRKAIKAVNEVMSELRVLKHPDKTFIGRIARGFDFLGYWFSPAGLGIAGKTVARMVDKVSRLYGQGADEGRIETYLNHWWRWVRSGVGGVVDGFFIDCLRLAILMITEASSGESGGISVRYTGVNAPYKSGRSHYTSRILLFDNLNFFFSINLLPQPGIKPMGIWWTFLSYVMSHGVNPHFKSF